MTQKLKQPAFDYCGDIADPVLPIKNPKSCKTKFMKDLNYKSNAIIRSEKNYKLNENSKQKDFRLKRQRTRKKSQIQSTQMKSLLEKIIPGAKITKGEWNDRKLNGEVEIQYDNGNKFVGKYQNGVRIEGKTTYPELKCEYQGSFFAQKFSGFGKLSYEGGRVIQGEWDNMEFIGNATITYPNKDVYYGPVDEKLYKHGNGYLFLHNGYKYVGNFSHGSITGIGSYYKDDALIIKGQWLKGKLLKEIGLYEQTDALEGSTGPQLEVIRQGTKVPSGSKFSYQFGDKDGINYFPKQEKSFQSSSQYSSQSFISLKQIEKKALKR